MARSVSVEGRAQVQRAGVSTWENSNPEDPFCPDDTIRILENSRAALVFRNEAVIRLKVKTTITITSEEEPQSLLPRLIEGAAHLKKMANGQLE